MIETATPNRADSALADGDTMPAIDATPAINPGEEIFDNEKSFEDLGLRGSVLKGIHAAGFAHPTRIQSTLIPVALTGRDILGQAKTGTGKTAAFGLPLLHLCRKDEPFQALVLAPTRELAIQITTELTELGKHTPIRATTVYGGQRMGSQIRNLERGPQIVVGTPGRLMDMVQRGHFHLKNIRHVVLDEVDRMLDIGFREDIRRILSMCPPAGLREDGPGRQTIFVSATISPDIDKLARQFMKNPEKLVVAAGSLTVSLVKQYHLPVQPWDKRRLLKHLLTHEEPDLTLIFCRMKRTVDDVARYLVKAGIDAHAMHADMPQSKRNSTMSKLRAGQLGVLVASDLASRGIDVEGISHVINYDLPDDIELYVHRIGRTARAGRGGIAWSLVTPEQGGLLTEIEKLINAEIPKLEYPDFEPGPIPEEFRRRQAESEERRQAKNRFAQPSLPTPAAVQVAEAPQCAAPNADLKKFPGGVVPTKMPPKRMHGRISSGRGR